MYILLINKGCYWIVKIKNLNKKNEVKIEYMSILN
jgi:hypothetical protein